MRLKSFPGAPGVTSVSPRPHRRRVARAPPPRNIPPHNDDATCRGGFDARSAPHLPQSMQQQRAPSAAPITSNGARVFKQSPSPPLQARKWNGAEARIDCSSSLKSRSVLTVEGQHACKLVGDRWEWDPNLSGDELTTPSPPAEKGSARDVLALSARFAGTAIRQFRNADCSRFDPTQPI